MTGNETLKRFDLEDVSTGYEPWREMVERVDGDWVRYEDYAALTAALDAATKRAGKLEEVLRDAEAYREWLRDGFRDIAQGKLSVAQKDDWYVQYAKDTLSGPTRETLDAVIKRREARAALAAGEGKHDG
jgi:hypothetical protein